MRKITCCFLFLSAQLAVNAQSPSIGGYSVYYGTLHNHSTVSDGTGTEDDAYNYAKNVAGLDYFSTANHVGSIVEAEWAAIKAASDKYNEDGVFTAFWGFEWSGAGDIAVINTDDYTGISEDPAGTFVQLCAWLEARNCVAFFNHPGRGGSYQFEGFTSTPTDKIVGMELFNKSYGFDVYYYNDGFYPYDGNLGHFAEANSRGWKIGASGADDNHGGNWGTRNDFRMAILAENLTRSDLFTAMQARRFYSTLDKNLALSFKLDTNEMGSTIEGGPYDVQIQAMDMDGESFTRVMLLRNGYEMNAWEINTTEVNLSFPINTFDGDFFHVVVRQADGNEAISSPVFIEGGPSNTPPTCALSTPENGIHYDIPQPLTIVAEASDPDGPVASVEFFINGNPVGSDTVAPYSIVYMIPANGSYEIIAKAKDEYGSWANSSPISFTTGVFSQIESSRIASGMDDVEENADGSMYISSSDIELVFDGSDQIIGLRFTGMNVPPGASIDSAFIQFTVDEVSIGACVLSVKGENADDSLPFTEAIQNVSSRETTSAELIWEPASWPNVGTAGADQRTPDLGSIVQEIVNRPGYTQSSAISVIITGTGERTAESYEGVPGAAALLTVYYAMGKEPSSGAQGVTDAQFRLFPNPSSSGRIFMETDASFSGFTAVRITDMTGRICYASQVMQNRTEIDVSGLKPGIYIVNLTDHNNVIAHKLIIE